MSNVSDSSKHELFRLICGDLIGSGVGRSVYTNTLDSDLVIKFEENAGSFQNVMEWQTWEIVKDTQFAKWFAPCIAISPCGTVLVQKKTTRADKYPAELPAFLCDIKKSNYGVLKNGDFVCHDYGFHMLMEKGMSKRMQKVSWTKE